MLVSSNVKDKCKVKVKCTKEGIIKGTGRDQGNRGCMEGFEYECVINLIESVALQNPQVLYCVVLI